jgi:hypothetical protein
MVRTHYTARTPLHLFTSLTFWNQFVKRYVATFVNSIVWIAALCWAMVELATAGIIQEEGEYQQKTF